jgi:acyl-CoA thioester hydrolase
MARVKIVFPDKRPLYTALIAVRIGDINYGGHAGNDAILSIIHEARIQALHHAGASELDAFGNSVIMADVMIAYKAESFYGDVLHVAIYTGEITDRSFDLLYSITTMRNDQTLLIAEGKTGMVCFDYATRKIALMGAGLRDWLQG